MKIATRNVDPGLTDKSVYRDQTLGDRIYGEEKTFERDGGKQGWTVRCNKTCGREISHFNS
jgi:hypothetical protein